MLKVAGEVISKAKDAASRRASSNTNFICGIFCLSKFNIIIGEGLPTY